MGSLPGLWPFQFHSFTVGHKQLLKKWPCAKGAVRDPCAEALGSAGFLRICRACCLIRARLLGAVTPNLWDFQQVRRNGEEVAQCHFFKFCPYFSASAQAVNYRERNPVGITYRRKDTPLGGAPLQRSFMRPNERGLSVFCFLGMRCISLGLSNAAAYPSQTRHAHAKTI